MRQRLNLPTMLLRLRDIGDNHVIVRTDGHLVRLLLRDVDNPETVYQYADLTPGGADALVLALVTRHRARPIRGMARWFTHRIR